MRFWKLDLKNLRTIIVKLLKVRSKNGLLAQNQMNKFAKDVTFSSAIDFLSKFVSEFIKHKLKSLLLVYLFNDHTNQNLKMCQNSAKTSNFRNVNNL